MYDTYDSCVVIAQTEAQAKNISIRELQGLDDFAPRKWPSTVVLIKAEMIGYPLDGSKEQIVCSSFNAG
jgi:hypothetical protein